jgi:hypothetical protein
MNLVRTLSAFGTAFLLLAGSLSLPSAAFAQTKDPAVCKTDCQKEYDSCIAQMGTQEMCSADKKICTKQCGE